MTSRLQQIDPTLEHDMVLLKNEVLAQNCVQEYLTELRSHSVGLVLAGGGGKGAYEGGVLLALYDCGLQDYEAIAGTSVGALNAALAHQLFDKKDRNIVARLWGNLSPDNVLSWTVLRTPVGFLMRIALFLSAAPAWLASRLTALLERSGSRSKVWVRTIYMIPTLAGLVLFAVVLALVLVLLVTFRGWPPDFDRATGVASGVILLSGAFLKSRDIVGRYLSLASNTPLLQMIRENIDIATLRRSKLPMYCTMAIEATWWDPFEPSEWSNVSDGAKRCSRTPSYLSLAEANSDDEAREWLLQSAALPEIFPRKAIRGHYAVDGGLVDNVPIYPVATHKPDRIIVVYLDHRLMRNEEFYTGEAARTWWMAELKALSELDTRQKANAARQRQIDSHGPISEGSRRLNLIPREPRLLTLDQFVYFIPTASVGNFFTGTLNFSAKNAQRLLKLGYSDGLAWIQSFAKSAETNG